MTLWRQRIRELFGAQPPIFEEEWSDSFPAIPEDMDCPDTMPTSPGALDSDLARLE